MLRLQVVTLAKGLPDVMIQVNAGQAGNAARILAKI